MSHIVYPNKQVLEKDDQAAFWNRPDVVQRQNTFH